MPETAVSVGNKFSLEIVLNRRLPRQSLSVPISRKKHNLSKEKHP